ncbi:MAG: proline--tRNA ligase, partial [Clostridia bacterium]|nr:proline--tRNA ligase [Clostridia bacterium]
VIIPIAMKKDGVLNKANEICEKLKSVCRVKIDDSEKSPGWKFSEYEMRGVPLRLEIGPKDIEKNQCVIVRRDNLEKIFVNLDDLEKEIPVLLQKVHDGMYQKALERRNRMTHEAHDFEEFKKIAENEVGFIKAMWCGDEKCEKASKEQTAFTSRCIKDEKGKIGDKCAICGKDAKHLVYWAKAY